MGILCEDPAFVYGDNQLMLVNTSMLVSTFKKKMNLISYHFIREGYTQDEWDMVYVNTHLNWKDLCTKCLPSGEKRWGFVRRFLNWL